MSGVAQSLLIAAQIASSLAIIWGVLFSVREFSAWKIRNEHEKRAIILGDVFFQLHDLEARLPQVAPQFSLGYYESKIGDADIALEQYYDDVASKLNIVRELNGLWRRLYHSHFRCSILDCSVLEELGSCIDHAQESLNVVVRIPRAGLSEPMQKMYVLDSLRCAHNALSELSRVGDDSLKSDLLKARNVMHRTLITHINAAFVYIGL